MTAILRLVLDQVVSPVDPDLAVASRELARALVATAPTGCGASAIVPAVSDAAALLEREVPGLADIDRAVLPRRELAAAWQIGFASVQPGGMIHSPTLMAPLVRHDRIHDHDQTVVTLWDQAAWERPHELARTHVAWCKAMLKRAVRHADAVIVPTHAAADRLRALALLGDRVRVMPGAAPAGFRAPTDEVGRRRVVGVPNGCLLVSGSSAPSARLADAFAGIAHGGSDLPVVVTDAPEGDEPAIMELASASGIEEARVHVRGALEPYDRAAVLAGAVALIAPATRIDFPWRIVEALAIGVPIIAADTEANREILVDGGLLADPAEEGGLAEALRCALASTSSVERLAVLSGDRGRAFTWAGAAERIWQLHADL